MADNKGESLEGLSAPPLNRAAVSAAVPLNARLAHEIPKPKDWQAFQRLCVLLFQAELNDLNAQEYGRVGQNQRGIDVLGRRNGNPDYYVGIQCRHIARPLKTGAMTVRHYCSVVAQQLLIYKGIVNSEMVRRQILSAYELEF